MYIFLANFSYTCLQNVSLYLEYWCFILNINDILLESYGVLLNLNRGNLYINDSIFKLYSHHYILEVIFLVNFFCTYCEGTNQKTTKKNGCAIGPLNVKVCHPNLAIAFTNFDLA